MMDNSMSPQGLNAVRASLTKINQICDALIAILDRSPELVVSYTGTTASKFDGAIGPQELNVDVIIRGFNAIEKHLNHILDALQKDTLYDIHYGSQTDMSSLVEALQYKRDVLTKKRRTSGFLDSTFGFRIDELTKKIDLIYDRIPLYTQKAA